MFAWMVLFCRKVIAKFTELCIIWIKIHNYFGAFCRFIKPKKVREKSRECHNHKPQPIPDPKRKRKPTNPNKHKPNKRTKSTKISSVFPKRGNRNTKRTKKHKNKMTHGKTYNKSPRRINHKATKFELFMGPFANVVYIIATFWPVLASIATCIMFFKWKKKKNKKKKKRLCYYNNRMGTLEKIYHGVQKVLFLRQL